MEILTQLTPTQVYLIQEGPDATLKDLLKYTLADLFIKEVLTLEERDEEASDSSALTSAYVSAGRNFREYVSQPHERCFLDFFDQNDDIEVLFKHLIAIGYRAAKSKRDYVYRRLIKNEALHGYFKTGFFNALWAKVVLTEEGLAIRDTIETTLRNLEEQLSILLKVNPVAAKQMLHQLQGNVLLLRGLDLTLVAKIDTALAQWMAQQQKREAPEIFVFLEDFDDWFDAFDSAFDAADASDSGSSGDSGDSGCSGCSGCGGCGGCS